MGVWQNDGWAVSPVGNPGLTTNNQRLSSADHAALLTSTLPARWWTYGASREGLTLRAATNIYCSHIWKAKGNGQLQENQSWSGSRKKTHTLGQAEVYTHAHKNIAFSIPLLSLSASTALSLHPTKLGIEQRERKKDREREWSHVSVKSTAQVHNQPNRVYAYWRAVPLKALLPARGVWVRLSQRDNKNHCCICLESPSKPDPPLGANAQVCRPNNGT